MITSRQNSKIKKVIQLSSHSKIRRGHAAFVVEGVRLLEESLNAGAVPEFILFSESLDQRGGEMLPAFENLGVSCELVESALFQETCSTETPQGILGVFPIKPPQIPGKLELVLILDEIRDPGNLGTLLRTALASGTDLVLISKGSVDLYSPKVVRSAMGAHFKLPMIKAAWDEISTLTAGLKLFLADMSAEQDLWETDLSGPLGLIIGGEAHGAGAEAHQRADQVVRIPMDPRAESLNAAAAGAILLFEILRQRSNVDI